jgi:tryptophan synthase beta chain
MRFNLPPERIPQAWFNVVIDEALAAKETDTEKVILFSYSGHGLLDLSAYNDYLTGQLDQV